MTVIRNTFTVRCTPEEAFDYLCDSRSELEWNPTCERAEKLTGGPVGAGTRFAVKWRGGPATELEVLTHDRPRSWTAVTDGGIRLHFTGRVEPLDEGVRFTAEFRPSATGWQRLLLPLIARSLRRSRPDVAEQIRDALERRSEEHAAR